MSDRTLYVRSLTKDASGTYQEEKSEHKAEIRTVGERLFVLYREEENGVDCTVSFPAKARTRITVTRTGGVRATMVFDTETESKGDYDTGFAEIPFSITTETVINRLTPDGGELRIVYRMTIGGESAYHDLTMQVK